MLKKHIVYLVDDDEDDRMFIREALETISPDNTISEFDDGGQLLRQLAQNMPALPSVIFLDMNMPRVSGMETLDRLRSNPETAHIPVVIFSTSSDKQAIADAYRAGANAYLIKPVSVPDYQQIARAITLTYLRADDHLFDAAHDAWQGTELKGVLVIEDNEDHWNIIRPQWARVPAQSHLAHARSAHAAMAYLESAFQGTQPPVELIVLDLYLPDRAHGLELLTAIRQLYAGQGLAPVPIIIFSASDATEDVQASYRRLASAYIPKSVDLSRSALRLKDICMAWSATIARPVS